MRFGPALLPRKSSRAGPSSAAEIAARRAAATRLIPCSYFCSCWYDIPIVTDQLNLGNAEVPRAPGNPTAHEGIVPSHFSPPCWIAFTITGR